MQHNNTRMLFKERIEIINDIVSEHKKTSTEAQDEIRSSERVIHWKLCKKQFLEPTVKEHMYQPESVKQNKTHYILRDYKIY